jgi:hypothetical protein
MSFYYVHEHSQHTGDKYWYFKKKKNAIDHYNDMLSDYKVDDSDSDDSNNTHYYKNSDGDYIELDNFDFEDK